MKIEHTPEPWSIEYVEIEMDSFHTDMYPTLQANGISIVSDDGFGTSSLDYSNAERIVTCVNACAGIDNETLIHAGVVQRGELGDVIRQRDQLVEALLLCMNAVRLAGWENDYCMEKANEALELIQPTTKGEQHA